MLDHAPLEPLALVLLDALCRLEIVGREIPEQLPGPAVLVANHSSHLDCPAVLRALPSHQRRRTVVAAASDYFFRSSPVATVARMSFPMVPVDRHGPARDALRNCEKVLDEGRLLLIFPEGTRSADGSIRHFHRGAAALAIRRGVPIMPIGVFGLHTLLPKGSRLPRPGHAAICFGPVVHPRSGEDSRRLTAHIAAQVASLQAMAAKTIASPVHGLSWELR